MANWFQDHPLTSIISHTLVVAAATWATSTFILQDNRLNSVRSEVDSQKTLVEQYKAKAELLQKDIEVLRAENQEYKNWLLQSKDAIPIIVPQIVELKKQLSQLKSAGTSSNGMGKVEVPQVSERTERSSANVKPRPIPRNLSEPKRARLGSAGIDETTGTIVTVKQTFAGQTALLFLTFPDRDMVVEERVHAGKQIPFTWAGNKLLLTIVEINFLTDSVIFRIQAAAK